MPASAFYPRRMFPMRGIIQKRRRFGPGQHGSSSQNATDEKFFARFSIQGVTRDSAGNPLAGVVVECFEAATDAKLAETISDGSGAYTISLGQNSGFFYLRAYLAGAPDVAGTTVNTIVAG